MKNKYFILAVLVFLGLNLEAFASLTAPQTVKLNNGISVINYEFSNPLKSAIIKRLSPENWKNAKDMEQPMMGLPLGSLYVGKQRYNWFGGFVAKEEGGKWKTLMLPELKELAPVFVSLKRAKKADVARWEKEWNSRQKTAVGEKTK